MNSYNVIAKAYSQKRFKETKDACKPLQAKCSKIKQVIVPKLVKSRVILSEVGVGLNDAMNDINDMMKAIEKSTAFHNIEYLARSSCDMLSIDR